MRGTKVQVFNRVLESVMWDYDYKSILKSKPRGLALDSNRVFLVDKAGNFIKHLADFQ